MHIVLAQRFQLDSTHKTRLARAVVSILRPLIRLLIRNEMTHAELTELVRQTYVEVAYDAYSIPEQEMTVSRAAVLTGLSRKEVVRLREILDNHQLPIKQAPNRAQRVVHGWLSDAEFLDRKKQPKVLPIKGQKGSFLALVRRYSGDITYGAVLDELNLVGVTRQSADDTVALVNRAYVPYRDEQEQVRIIAMCVSDLFNTAVHNIEASKSDRLLQRQVVYSGVEPTLADKFCALATKKSTALLDELNDFLATGRKKSTPKKRKKGRRLGVGIYYFEEDPESERNQQSKEEP